MYACQFFYECENRNSISRPWQGGLGLLIGGNLRNRGQNHNNDSFIEKTVSY